MKYRYFFAVSAAAMLFAAAGGADAQTNVELPSRQFVGTGYETVSFNEPVDARGKLLRLNYGTQYSDFTMSLDGLGITLKNTSSNVMIQSGSGVFQTIKNRSGSGSSGGTSIAFTTNDLALYIPDSHDYIQVFVDGCRVTELTDNDSTDRFTGITLDGNYSVTFNSISIDDMPGTITAAFVDNTDENTPSFAIEQDKVYLKPKTSVSVTLPPSKGITGYAFNGWYYPDSTIAGAENSTVSISSDTIFTAKYSNTAGSYTPSAIPGLVQTVGRYFYVDNYDTDATALSVDFAPMGTSYGSITVTPVSGKTTYTEPQTINTPSVTNAYIRCGIIINEIVPSDAFTASAHN